MARTLVGSYSFNPNARTVTLTGVATPQKYGLSSIRNTRTGETYYLRADVDRITLVGQVVTLPVGVITIAALSTDALTIYYDDTITAPEDGGGGGGVVAIGDVAGLQTALDLKATVTAVAAKADASALTSGLAVKATKPASVFYASDYGLVGNWTGGDATAGTGTNDTAALNTLIAAAPAGSTIVFDGSKTYRLDPLATITKTLTLDGNGASVVTKTMATGVYTAGSPLFRFSSALGTARAFGAVALWATSVTTTTAAHAGDFSPGDYVFVSDNFELVNWQDGSHQGAGRGEINVVETATAARFAEYSATADTMTGATAAFREGLKQYLIDNPDEAAALR